MTKLTRGGTASLDWRSLPTWTLDVTVPRSESTSDGADNCMTIASLMRTALLQWDVWPGVITTQTRYPD